MAEQNTPINGNANPYGQSNTDINNLIAVVATLTQNMSEMSDVIKQLQRAQDENSKAVAKGLKEVSHAFNTGFNSIGKTFTEGMADVVRSNNKSGKGSGSKGKSSSNSFTTNSKSTQKDGRGTEINLTAILNKMDAISKAPNKPQEDISRSINDLNKTLSLDNKLDKDVTAKFLKNIEDSVTNITNRQDTTYKKALDDFAQNINDIVKTRLEIASNKAKGFSTYQNELDLTFYTDTLSEIQEYLNQEAALYQEEYKAEQERVNALKETLDIYNSTNELFGKTVETSSSEFQEKFRKLFKPKENAEYKAKIAEVEKSDAEIDAETVVLNVANADLEEFVRSRQAVINDYDNELANIDKLLTQAEANEDKAEVARLKEQRETVKRDRNEVKASQTRAKQEQENNRIRLDILNKAKKNNEETKKNIDKQYTVLSQIGTKVGDTLSKAITAVITREMDLFVQAADSAFNAIESAQKSLGKTLKMDTGEYQDYVDLVQQYAKEAGVAVDQNQILELASSLSDMGIRDKTLITTLATEQAKAQEAGVGSIFQMNEEFIKQYQKSYFADRNATDEKTAQENLQKQLDTWIATEAYIAEEFGSATALANGGMTEIANYANQLQKSNYLTADNASEFNANLAIMAQAIENSGGDFSTILSDLQTILDNPESDLSASLLTAMGTNREDFINRLSADPMEVLADYLTKMQDRYTGLNLTDLTYKSRAYGESMRATDIKALISTDLKNVKGVTQEDLGKTADDLMDSLKSGDMLTATEKLEKTNLQMAQDVAQIAQTVPDGQYWMNNTLSAGKSLLTEFTGFLSGLIGNALGSKISGLGGGSTAAGKATLGDVALGNKNTKGGLLASELSGLAGIGYSEVVFGKDVIQGIYNGDHIQTAVGDALGDPQFARGMGMALGGAVGGPVGAAIGGVVTEKVVPKAQSAFEDLITSGIVSPSELAYQKQQEAANELKESANDLKESATEQLNAIQAEKARAEQWSTMQKKEWLEANKEKLTAAGIDTSNIDLSSTESINENFDSLFETYTKAVEEGLTSDLSLAELGSALASPLAEWANDAGVEIGDKLYATQKEVMQALDAGEISSTEASTAMAELAGKGTQSSASATMLKKLGQSGYASNLMNTIEAKKSAISKANPKMSASEVESQALASVAESLGYNETQALQLKSLYSTIDANREEWEKANAEFQEKFIKAQEKVGTNDTNTIIQQYLADNANADEELFRSFVVADPHKPVTDGNSIWGMDEITEVPSLATNNDTYNWYTPGDVVPKYKTGLDYVPSDNYLALLHRGESVLNATEAQDYREQTTVNFDSINDTLVAQTDRIENVLNKILDAITYIGRGSNKSTLNPNILGMVSGIATL